MAISFRQLALIKTSQEVYKKCISNYQLCQFSTSTIYYKKKLQTNKKEIEEAQKAVIEKRIESLATSLASKGFLRSSKPYNPPGNVNEKIKNIFSTFNISTKLGYTFSNLEEKFKILNACSQNFKHCVPNSQLHEVNTIDDVINFYKIPVDTTVPLEKLKTMELPENLHIQYEYVRFNPETDTMFNGETAFPKSSTLVTGLKYRNKYPGHEVKRSWP